jgi:hypothetical protein
MARPNNALILFANPRFAIYILALFLLSIQQIEFYSLIGLLFNPKIIRNTINYSWRRKL